MNWFAMLFRLAEEINRNREAEAEISRLREVLASRDLQMTSVEVKVKSLTQTVAELQTNNAGLLRRVESMSSANRK